MRIREATEADIPAIVEMGRRFFETSGYGEFMAFDPDSVVATARRLMASESGTVIVAVNDRPVGMVAGLIYPYFMNYGHVTGQEMFWWVEPEHRAAGTGKDLLRALEAWARDAGAHSFIMGSLEALRPLTVAALYRRLGYKPIEHLYLRRL